MNEPLVPKKIKDKNGKLTTVHTRAEEQAEYNKRIFPAPKLPTPTTLEEKVELAQQELERALDSRFPKYELKIEEAIVPAITYYEDRYPEYKAIDIEFTVPTPDGDQGVVMVYQGTDYQFTNRYTFTPYDLSDETVAILNNTVHDLTPELMNLHDLTFEKVNGYKPEHRVYPKDAKEARVYLLELAGYEPFHDQLNSRLLGMCRKIARQERFAHHMPQIMESARLLIESGDLMIYDDQVDKFNHSWQQHERVLAYERA